MAECECENPAENEMTFWLLSHFGWGVSTENTAQHPIK